MTPVNKWFWGVIVVFILSGVGWYFGIGVWAGYTYFQFQLLTGQATITIGIAVLLYEVQKKWYDE